MHSFASQKELESSTRRRKHVNHSSLRSVSLLSKDLLIRQW